MGFNNEIRNIDEEIEDCEKYIQMFGDVVKEYKDRLERLKSDRCRGRFHTQDNRDNKQESRQT